MSSPFIHRKMALGFYGFNLSRDGVVKASDLAEYARRVAEALRPDEEPARARLEDAFRKLWDFYFAGGDKDGDDAVTFEEVMAAHGSFVLTPESERIMVQFNKQFFDALDFNGDGTIDEREFAAFLRPLGLSDERVRSAFRHLDRDGNGTISQEEFAQNWWEFWNSDDPSAPGNWFYG